MSVTALQEQQLLDCLATIRKVPYENEIDAEWTDAHQYGENVSDAYDKGVRDGRDDATVDLANKIRVILGIE